MAAGHNGGQAVDYFERPFSDIAREFGLKMASAGQIAIQSSWRLLRLFYVRLRLLCLLIALLAMLAVLMLLNLNNT